ncbi:MAG: LysM peptidoglycan-binding domain-containing protein [Chloroflexi bacterium]|nr:MAG: LysM peptidoglycan-binding domain-containing protein [Chloroflexota bacterium]
MNCWTKVMFWLVGIGSGIGMLVTTAVSQPLPTATPDTNGLIYYEVQPGDSLWSIAARHQLSLSELLALNNLTADAIIQPGDKLIVGQGTPAPTPTQPTMPTPTLPPPTPSATPLPSPSTKLCLLAFADENGNGTRDANEPLEPAVTITIYNETAVVANYITDGISEPYCLTSLPAGTYRISRSLHPDEVATTPNNLSVSLFTGQTVTLQLGQGKATATPQPTHETSDNEHTPETKTAVSPTTTSTATPTNPTPLTIPLILLFTLSVIFFWVRIQNSKNQKQKKG